ncbi:YegJ family protein [Limnoglobus roseus]|uniref:DUF2314 domain-containing protein n=1 Tax=Limnoglobus roseus TaxID=2598579 RepID=A0A5C1A3M7_9BACT|nr:DUF2314 domain-containing protein [Limnoglobus roseus]QEL13691.1 hypothetical protein PX52LOC_00549 [Limnoglobus roseus]
MKQLLGVALVIALVGCGKKPVEDKVSYVADDDPGMKAAIEKARTTVSQFTAVLKAPKPTQKGLSVKMAFADGKNTEHMWLSNVTLDGTTFHGIVNNDPEHVKTVKIGDKASIEVKKISDWMYIENKKLVGGYTLRALRDAMPPAERAEMDKSLPFTVD